MIRENVTRRAGTPAGPPMTTMVAAMLAASLAISGCSGGSTSSTAPSTSSPADNTRLLIQASDIDLPGVTFTAAKPPQGLAKGAAVAFINHDSSVVIDDRITIAPDSASAGAGFNAAKDRLSTFLPNTTTTDVPVGQGGAMAAAKSKDGAKAVTTITFHEGTANVTIEFDSPINNPLPDGFPLAVAQKQDAVVKSSGLAG